jgi:4-amino-4-deoxy-L-arabinose transferase-like glycosyltransferase
MGLLNKVVLGFILLVSLFLMVGSSRQESATMDELAHIPAGYSYVKYFDYRLNPEHPPLVKMLAGLPLLALDPKLPTDSPAWREMINGQWDVGNLFLYESSNNADQIVQLARVGPMVLMLLLILVVYFWSREIMGDWWALLPTLATAISPNLLAHGHYVTTDVGAALGIVLSLFFFTRYLATPTKKNLIWAGIYFGIAQLMKFSAALLVIHFVVVSIIVAISRTSRSSGHLWRQTLRSTLRYTGRALIIFAIGALVIYPPYWLATLNYPPAKQLADTTSILQNFPASPTPSDQICHPLRCLADITTWGADKPLIRPYSQYLLGLLMVIQRSAGGNTAYFLGEVSNTGDPAYFPLVYLLKESLSMLILIILAILFGLYNTVRALLLKGRRFKEYLITNLYEFSALIFIILYALYSITSPLNIGFRHLIPIVPLIYILTIGTLKKYICADYYRKQLRGAFLVFMFLWLVISSLLAYPHYLSYFNELVGTDNGWRYVVDSNYDWGQDLKRLAAFVEEHQIDKIAVDYFGAGSPQYYLGAKADKWSSSMGDPRQENISWVAISVNQIQNSTGRTAPGFSRQAEDEYPWLKYPTSPDFVVGKSIFVFHLERPA